MIDTSKIYSTKNNGDLRILKYNKASEIEVEFISTGYKTTTRSIYIDSGMVKDYLIASVCGVGCLGDGKYKSSNKGVTTIQYRSWHDMINRCYNIKRHNSFPTYSDCTVCSEWLNFQVFAKWFDENHIKGTELDKDLKTKGNRIYSPANCSFISKKENITISHEKKYLFTSPKGDLIVIVNLAEFCRNNNLTRSAMCLVNSGERIAHKEWTRASI